MAEKEVYIGSVGPFLFEENDFYGIETTSQIRIGTAPTIPDEVVRYQDAVMSSGDQTIAGKKTFDGEVELNNTLNHDGAAVGFYGATPVPQASAIAPLVGIANNTDLTAALNAVTAVLRALGLIAT